MNKIAISISILAALLLSRSTSFAWSSPGHMVIAAIAYRELPADEKAKVNELLQYHPAYEKWKEAFLRSGSDFDFNTFIFMRASVWPDEIRRRGSPFDHPEWHFIDYPLEPPAFPEIPGPSPTNDILYGINESEKILKNPNSPPEIRAVYLSWLIHLVGDIHQPLHCATLVNQNYSPPVGDKGGNDFFVRPSEAPVKLHSIWDKALGSTVNIRGEFNYATRISAEHSRPSLPELFKHKIPASWSIESRALAIEDGYLHGHLKGSKEAANAPPLPSGYTKTMKTVAERQAALAGYRLADEIEKYVQ